MMNHNIEDPYKSHGYANRDVYLKSLAVNLSIDKDSVFSLAELLGPSEDFDGLIFDLKDFSQFIQEIVMITLPNTGEKQVHADSTGKPIAIGDKIKFRGQNYTLKEFGPNEDHYDVATLIFKEALHTSEIPHECNVDKV